LIPRIGRNKVVALGLVAMAGSFCQLATATSGTSYWALLPALVVNGMGIMFVVSVTNDTILASAPKERTGAAAAISETANEIGGALGIAILGSVLTAVYRTALTLPTGLSGSAAEAARESVGGAVQAGTRIPGATGHALIAAADQAFTHSMGVTSWAGAALLAAGGVGALVALRGVPAEIIDPPAVDPADAPVPAVR
jgi:MFS family permease